MRATLFLALDYILVVVSNLITTDELTRNAYSPDTARIQKMKKIPSIYQVLIGFDVGNE